eukprot:scaffold7089_cov328-Pinguiococcus_pyrenoidosus.AAC.2
MESASAALRSAVAKGRLAEAEGLLRPDTDLNAADSEGWTLLLLAAFSGGTELCAWLLERGAALDGANNNGATALYVAAQKGHADVVELLVQRGANVEARTSVGATP